jgi:hypothetical protein
MAFKIEQLLNGSENSVTLIGKTKHHLLCQSRQNKDHKLKKLLEQKSFWNDRPLLQIKKAIIFDMMIDIRRRI